MPVTIKDIARKANVDDSTVSRVLRDHSGSVKLKPETRERVKRIAAELGYHRNALASAIRTGENRTIALISSTVLSSLPGIQKEAEHLGYGVRLFSSDDLKETFELIESERIRFVLVFELDQKRRELAASLAHKYKMKLVFLDTRGAGGFHGVTVDHFQTTYTMTDYLLSCGHRRIGILCSPHTQPINIERHNGYLAAMRNAGISVRGEWQSCGLHPDFEGYRKLFLSGSKRNRPTAVICSSVGAAAELLRFFRREAGLRCPEDVSIVTICSQEEADLTDPEMTFITPVATTASAAATHLLLTGKCAIPADEENNHRITLSLVEQESVKKIGNGRDERRLSHSFHETINNNHN